MYITREIERKYRRKNTIKRRRPSAQGESKCPLTGIKEEGNLEAEKPTHGNLYLSIDLSMVELIEIDLNNFHNGNYI